MNADINDIELRRIDLNLLVVFASMLRERSVRSASRRLALTPPAVSMALGRLRDLFDDPLFVRGKRAMEPTPRALALGERLAPALREIHGVVFDAPSFDPKRAEQTIRFASPDDLEIALLPRVFATLRKEAPGISLVVRPSDYRIVPEMLDSGDADLALAATPAPIERRHRHEVLYTERFAALYDPKRLGRGRLTMSRYLATPQVLVSQSGIRRGPIDDRLAELGRSRQALCALAHFSTLPFLLRSADVLANVPSTAAREYARAFGLLSRPLPFESPRFDVTLLWHARRETDPALVWFRERVKALCMVIR